MLLNAVAADLTPPTVAITSPQPNAILTGSIPATANAADDVGVAGVSFWADLKLIAPEDTVAPYSVTLDTTTLKRHSCSYSGGTGCS